MKPFWVKPRKKSIIRDAKTGEEYTLSSPRYGRRQRKECLGGCRITGLPRHHDSGEEACLCNKLRILKKIGEVKDYQAQVTFPLRDRTGAHVGNHRVDFLVEDSQGGISVWEYKGSLFLTLREWQFAKALFTWTHPNVPYQVKTQKDLI